MKLNTNRIRFLGLCLRKWHLYLILSLVALVLVGCAAGLLMLGSAAMSGSSGGGGSSWTSGTSPTYTNGYQSGDGQIIITY